MADETCPHCGGGPQACAGSVCRYYVRVKEWRDAAPARRGLLQMSDLQSLAYRMRVAEERLRVAIERAKRSIEGYQHSFLNRDLSLSMKVAGARDLVADLNMIFNETSGGPREPPAVDVVGAGQPAPGERDGSSSGVAVDLLPAAGPEETGASSPHEPTQRWLVEAIERVLCERSACGSPNAVLLLRELQRELARKDGG